MKTLIILVVLFLISSNLYSQKIITEQVSGTTQTLTSVSSNSGAPMNSHAWICGYGGTVLRTTNGGTNWINVSGNGIPSNTLLVNIVAISTTTAVTAGYVGSNTFVYRTSNSGANWTQVFTEANGFIDAICFKTSSSIGFMVGDPVGGRWSLWKTTNGGANWDSTGLYLPQVGTEAGWNNCLFNDANGDRLWFGTNNTKIYYSTNFGTNWTAQPTASEVNTYAIWFKGLPVSSTGLTGGISILSTSNNGSNWSVISGGPGNVGGITGGPYIITEGPGYFHTMCVRGTNVIYVSSNNGVSWAILYTASAGTYRHISSNNLGSETWGVRNNGGITLIYMPPAGITQISSLVPDKFTLYQNYPNPFNPVTKINYSIPNTQYTILKVFDALGKEVSTLVNEKQNAGTYSVDFDASNFNSGVYFYKLQNDNFTETKSMLLVK